MRCQTFVCIPKILHIFKSKRCWCFWMSETSRMDKDSNKNRSKWFENICTQLKATGNFNEIRLHFTINYKGKMEFSWAFYGFVLYSLSFFNFTLKKRDKWVLWHFRYLLHCLCDFIKYVMVYLFIYSLNFHWKCFRKWIFSVFMQFFMSAIC